MVVDLVAIARSGERLPTWRHTTEDLNVNLLVLDTARSIAEHRNQEVDVLLVGVDGTGCVTVEGRGHEVRAGQAMLIAKGSRRSIRSNGGTFAYLTCHRWRGLLWPAAPSSTR